MATNKMMITVRLAWWFKWLVIPACRAWSCAGLPVSEEWFVRTGKNAARCQLGNWRFRLNRFNGV